MTKFLLGECRLPASWQLDFLNGANWQPVKAKGHFAVGADKWCEVAFDPVTTTALCLRVKLQKDWAAGVHEWKVLEGDEVMVELADGVVVKVVKSTLSDVRTKPSPAANDQ